VSEGGCFSWATYLCENTHLYLDLLKCRERAPFHQTRAGPSHIIPCPPDSSAEDLSHLNPSSAEDAFYRRISLIRNPSLRGPYSRTSPRALRRPKRGVLLRMSKAPLQSSSSFHTPSVTLVLIRQASFVLILHPCRDMPPPLLIIILRGYPAHKNTPGVPFLLGAHDHPIPPSSHHPRPLS